MTTLQQLQTEAREKFNKEFRGKDMPATIIGPDFMWDPSSEKIHKFIEEIITQTYETASKEGEQRGRDMAVDYIVSNYAFGLDELSKSGGEKLQKVLQAARSQGAGDEGNG